jgi:uncharacterized protein YeaC (DUF1315 family)
VDFDKLISNLTPDIYQNLKRSVELGKWPDGKALTKEQKALSMQAVIAYESKFVGEEQRAGYIDRGHKEEGETCGSHEQESPTSPLKWS